MTWREFLAPYQVDGASLCSEAFLQRWGDEAWKPEEDDRKAAGKLHTQIASRITTQALGYLDGVEETALKSVYTLFHTTRDIVDEFPKCRLFDAVAWDVLNTRVRPFTAKWHRESQRGALGALDATDEFRAKLKALQPVLRRFDDLLLHLRDDRAAPKPAQPAAPSDDVEREMNAPLRWGILPDFGGIGSDVAEAINKAERTAICDRRKHYPTVDHTKPHAVALALSGGGIRSATFSLGVLEAMARRGLLPQFDYLSTVSGGGYLGSFLSAFLQSNENDVGLEGDKLPFTREKGEAPALRHIRHHSKYLLTGSFGQRIKMMFAQLYGMVLNGLVVVWLLTLVVLIERWLRSLPREEEIASVLTVIALGALGLGAIGALVALRFRGRLQQYTDTLVVYAAMALVAILCWRGLARVHDWYGAFLPTTWTWSWSLGSKEMWTAIAGVVPVVASALAGIMGRWVKRLGVVLVVLTAISAPLFSFGIYLVIYSSSGYVTNQTWWVILALAVALIVFLDINFTSPHRHYRNKLAEAYLIQSSPFQTNDSIRLSKLGSTSHRAPYHLINCALNVPASKNEKMQGRLTDFFLFSPRYCGSPLIGYDTTDSWEKADKHLDLGTAMAISAAAAAPQMGLGTVRRYSFWLALLNIRLGYWARKPGGTGWRAGAPGLRCLFKEMLGTMDESGRWLNLSDGGHIENLGVYELLRRRCKYIVAVDGEEDSKMTFHGLTTLQRMAAIDLGVRIDIDLDNLRLNERSLSRSHFCFCRIRYPRDGDRSKDQIGYLLYVKLSLTGNEGEFLRRYRVDEPIFPHHSTADQFFSEAQFEAYRSLGEHVGDKLFSSAFVGDLPDSRLLVVEDWFKKLGENLLEPLLKHVLRRYRPSDDRATNVPS